MLKDHSLILLAIPIVTMLCWGIGLVCHYIDTFVDNERLRDRLIAQELQKHNLLESN